MNDPHSLLPRDNGASKKNSRDGSAPHEDKAKNGLRGWLWPGRRPKNTEAIREALDELIEDRTHQSADPVEVQERDMLSNILRLRGRTAYDVMIPRADIVAVAADTPLDDLRTMFRQCGHSRLPVYRDDLDDVIGMIHIKDLLTDDLDEATFQLPRMMRRVMFVSPAMRVMEMLFDMRQRRTHMALVVDEYGGIDGLVTIEDLVEQIVGEIEDEHDQGDEPTLHIRPDGVIEADARTSIEQFESAMGSVLTDEEREQVDTLGGLVFYLAGRVPSRGEVIAHSANLEFEVTDADSRRIRQVRVRLLTEQPTVEAD